MKFHKDRKMKLENVIKMFNEEITPEEKYKKWKALLDKLNLKLWQCKMEIELEKRNFINTYGSI
jgi:hypothetical protein